MRERDEARAELRNRRADFDRGIQEQNELRMRTEATVERLRAAQQIPDVGPVTRDEEGQLRIDGTLCYQQPDAGSAALRYQAATRLAMAAFLDAEAVDHTHDDEAAVRHALDCAQSFINEHNEFSSDDVIRCAVRAAFQHRARNGQEAGQ